MHSASDRPHLNALLKKSVLAWRAGYLASKATQQQVMGEETPVEPATAVPLKIRRLSRAKARR